jgi:hypothetical protein
MDEAVQLNWCGQPMRTGEMYGGTAEFLPRENPRVRQRLDHFRQLVENGVTKCDQIATEMKLSPATVCRLAKKAIAAGWLKTMKRQYVLTQERGTLESHFTTEVES